MKVQNSQTRFGKNSFTILEIDFNLYVGVEG